MASPSLPYRDLGDAPNSVHLYFPISILTVADGLIWVSPPLGSAVHVDLTQLPPPYITPGRESPRIFHHPPSLNLHPPPPPPPTPTSATFTTLAIIMAPPSPPKVAFLLPTSNRRTELEPLTPPGSVPPSPRLRPIDLPPTSSGYCTPTSPGPVGSPVPQQPTQQPTRIHCALYQANELHFDARMTLQPRLVPQSATSGRSSPLFEYDTTTLAEAATSPPLPSILLVCDNLPWKIRVSSSLPNLFITNYDVLQAIHVNLRTPVVTAEWSLCGTPQDQGVILQVFERRVRSLSNEFARAEERARSVRRVDCLMGMTRLVRITPSEDPEVFVIEWGWP
jgi:hypothetical protein